MSESKVRGYCDRLRDNTQSLERELKRKTALLEKISEALSDSPHGFVKKLHEEILHELELGRIGSCKNDKKGTQ